MRKAAKAAADVARHQGEPVAAAIGQATKEAAQSVKTVRDVMQGQAHMQTVPLNAYQLQLLCKAETTSCRRSTKRRGDVSANAIRTTGL